MQCMPLLTEPNTLIWNVTSPFHLLNIALLQKDIYSWAHVKEIPNTKLLVSLQFTHCKSASMKIFDISHQSRIKNIGSFVIHGGNFYLFWHSCENIIHLSSHLAPGEGDVSYNKRRNFLGTFSLQGKFAYHLFNIEYGNSQNNHRIKLLQEAKCQSQKNKKGDFLKYAFLNSPNRQLDCFS